MKILNYQDYDLCIEITNEFINNLNESTSPPMINIKPIVDTLSLNVNLCDVFNNLVNQVSPLVNSLCNNTSISNNTEVNALLTLDALMIFYLDERKLNRVPLISGYESDDVFREDIRNVLEELKMSGNGNGTVKKISECIGIISSIITLVYGKEVDASIFVVTNEEHLVKIINSIGIIIDTHAMSIEQFIQNFTIVTQGLSSKSSDSAINDIFNTLGIKNTPIGIEDSVIDLSKPEDGLGDIIIERK